MQGAQQWYMAIGGHQVGPVSQDEILANLRNGSIDRDTLVFTSGMPNWQPLKDVPAFAAVGPPAGGRSRAAAALGARAPRPRHRLHHPRHRDAVRRGRARPRRSGGRRGRQSMMFMDRRHRSSRPIFGDGSRTQRPACSTSCWAPGKRLLTGESAVHDGLHQQRGEQAAGGLRRALSRQDPADGPARARRHADLPEGLVPLRGARRVDRHRLPAQARRRHLRRRGLHHAEARRRRPVLRPRRRHRPCARTAAPARP